MLIIINPCAGGGEGEKIGQFVKSELEKRGLEFDSRQTEGPNHATELVHKYYALGERIFVTIGGDGTINEAVNGLDGPAYLGIIPAGTGNDLIRSLGIPNDPAQALDIILSGNTVAFDLPKCNSLRFANVCGLGFDADTIVRSAKLKKYVPKKMLYMVSLLITLFTFKFKEMDITTDGVTVNYSIMMVSIANGKFYGNGIPVSPLSAINDGYLEVCLITKVPRIRIPAMLLSFLKGTHGKYDKYVKFLQVKNISISAKNTENVQVDGDIRTCSPVNFNIGSQINVFAPDNP